MQKKQEHLHKVNSFLLMNSSVQIACYFVIGGHVLANRIPILLRKKPSENLHFMLI